jgi:hypothetical protein
MFSSINQAIGKPMANTRTTLRSAAKQMSNHVTSSLGFSRHIVPLQFAPKMTLKTLSSGVFVPL